MPECLSSFLQESPVSSTVPFLLAFLLTSKYAPVKPLTFSLLPIVLIFFLCIFRASAETEFKLASCLPLHHREMDCPTSTNRLLRSRPAMKSYDKILYAISRLLPCWISLVFLALLEPLSRNSLPPWLLWSSPYSLP